MVKFIAIIAIAAVVGCHLPQTNTPQQNVETVAAKDSTENNLAKLTFDSKKDLSCGMPISAGVSDTAQYKGKLYGFCSAECKADFLKDPEAHLKAK